MDTRGMPGDLPPDWLIRDAFERVRPGLTEGLDPDQVEWTRRAYESAVLPYHLRTSPAASDDQRRRIAEQVAQEIGASVAGLSPDQKWAKIVHDYYTAALLPLSEAAFGLARQTYRDGRVTPEAAQQAEQVRRWVADLQARMAHDAPGTLEALRPIISETLLDADYAREPGNAVSFRLNEVMQDGTAAAR